MTRYNSFITKIQPDFWRDRFKPKDLMRVFSHIQSVLSSRLDMKLLEAYDIKEIPEHTVGYTRTWIPIQLGGETYLGSTVDYPWMYAIIIGDKIDSDWLYIDAIYDKHVDPEYSYQNGLDYTYSDGIIRFRKKVPETIETLYIAKGTYAGYRIKHEIGSLLKYERKDSKFYRDSIEPIMVSFYKYPTYTHLIAMLNVAFGMPVVKYEEERVISTGNNKVVTDRYTYDIPTELISVKQGDILRQFEPLTNSINLVTNKTRPGWWKEKPAEMFQKYILDRKADGHYTRGSGITEEDKEILLSKFLEDVLVYIEIELDSVNVDAFIDSKDILDLFYDALPTRTDPILSKIGRPSDLIEEIDIPDTQELGVRLYIDNIYGTKNIHVPIGIYSPDLGRPTFLAENEADAEEKGLTINPLTFSIDDHSWHIFDENEDDNFREFWKNKVDGTPLMEPPVERIYFRYGAEKPWDFDDLSIRDIDLYSPKMEYIRIEHGGRLEDFRPGDIINQGNGPEINPSMPIKPAEQNTGIQSNISGVVDLMSSANNDGIDDVSFKTAESNVRCHPDVLEDWNYLSKDVLSTPQGLTLRYPNSVGLVDNINDKIYLGELPKTLIIRTTYDSPREDGARILIDWHVTGSRFTKELSSKEQGKLISTEDSSIDEFIINNAAGYLTLYTTLIAEGVKRPTLHLISIAVKDTF